MRYTAHFESMNKQFEVLKTSEFDLWLNDQTPKTRTVILARLDLITIGHFGNHKRFEGLIELKWLNGTRAYTFIWGDTVVVALYGGNKKMAKIATSKKQKKSGTKSLKTHKPFASKELKDSHLVADTLLECIRSGDIESFREVLAAHLMTVNKTAMAKKFGIGRRTLYDLMDPSKSFNPELSTISAVIKSLAA